MEEEFDFPQLPEEFVRDMRNDSISDSEFARSVPIVLEESSSLLRFTFFAQLPSYRPSLFERLALALERLKEEDSQNIRFFLKDLKNEEVSTDRFTQLWLMLCGMENGEFLDNHEILGILYGLTKIYRPSMPIIPIAVVIVSKRKESG